MGTAGGGVSKAALSRVPRQARSYYIWLAAIWASYCGILHGFKTSNISGAMGMSTFKETLGWVDLSSATVSNYKGWITFSMLLGQTAGILLSGPLMERSGRKILILIAAITYTIGSLLMAANFGSLAQLLAGRAVSGLGSGIAYSAGPVYLSEIAPAELRGMLSMSPWGPFALFAACTFCGIIWVFLAFPECKGRSMESTKSLFVLPWYKVGFAPVSSNHPDDNDGDLEKDMETQHQEFVSVSGRRHV
ncbi:hypothetical protein BDV36DRAFT_293074 [Aspergillus pseudocaelatus]|uniref:Major facilitator superfamily (MFS) profile domain-containing protein n=1 Tax=Aspergillus pseudocaelatus TaxID=1825620 RepID=A0ABQ6WU62_9EURO|nr:hypothetical protein BDV36DRAFT_293074 [Aspergillus pseudocaelatus]